MSRARPLRVLMVTHYFPPHSGGIEFVAMNEVRQLAAAGAKVDVLTSEPGGSSSTRVDPTGFTLHRIRAWNGLQKRFDVPFPFFRPSVISQTFRLVRRSDVVHVHDSLYMAGWFAALWCLLLRKPLVVTQHVQLVAHPVQLVQLVQRLVYGTVGRFVLRVARRVIVLNSSVSAFVAGLGVEPSRITVLANGVDTELYRPPADDAERARLRRAHGLPAEGVLALFVGRPVPKKGIDVLLEAAKDEVPVVIVGGPLPQQLDGAGAICLGELAPSRLSEVYRACDIFVLPSEAEGFPLTVQEAMASGLPVITTDDPGYDLYELDRRLVRLVQRDVAGVRVALVELAASPATRADMAAYSDSYSRERFDWGRHCVALLRIYQAHL